MDSMDLLPEIDPFSPDYQRDPIAAIEDVRARAPLARSARGLEVLTYEGCAEVYADENYVSATPLLAASMGLDFSSITGSGRTLTNSEGGEHAMLRGVVSAWFTPKRVRELRPAVVDLVQQRIAPITARGGGDFAGEVADQIPAPVFCWMIAEPHRRLDRELVEHGKDVRSQAGVAESREIIRPRRAAMAPQVDRDRPALSHESTRERIEGARAQTARMQEQESRRRPTPVERAGHASRPRDLEPCRPVGGRCLHPSRPRTSLKRRSPRS